MSTVNILEAGDTPVTKETTVTVDVDDRGRIVIPEPARRAIGVAGGDVLLDLEIRTLEPDDAEGSTASTDARVDDRGRITIGPPQVRTALGIKDREGILEITISRKQNHTRGRP